MAGTYNGAPSSRNNRVELVADATEASDVTLNGTALTKYANKAAFDLAAAGWYIAGGNLVIAKSGSMAVATTKTFQVALGQASVSQTFTCANGTTTTMQSVNVVGSSP